MRIPNSVKIGFPIWLSLFALGAALYVFRPGLDLARKGDYEGWWDFRLAFYLYGFWPRWVVPLFVFVVLFALANEDRDKQRNGN